jgi:hypothetical protein
MILNQCHKIANTTECSIWMRPMASTRQPLGVQIGGSVGLGAEEGRSHNVNRPARRCATELPGIPGFGGFSADAEGAAASTPTGSYQDDRQLALSQ